jgi:uncharacterized membrane protein HdeD (DUF308 family)
MAHRDLWWHRPWVRATESVCYRTIAAMAGLLLMVIGLWLAVPSPDVMAPGLTMVALPIGIFLGFIGVAVLMAGLFAHFRRRA